VRAWLIAAVAAGCVAGCAGARPATRARVMSAYRFHCAPRDARVVVDEQDQGQCVLWETQYLGLGPGVHRLRIEREGYLPTEQELSQSGRRETVTVQLRERPE
jgi:hypothetical protein